MGSQDEKSIENVADQAAVEQVAAEVTAPETVTGEAKAAAQPEGSRFDHIKETLEILYEMFPQAFIKTGNCKPLKIGIFEDLKVAIGGKEGLSLSKVRAALRYYTTRLRYLYSLKEGAKRVGLDGVEGEAVTKDHADDAHERFKEINKKRIEKNPALKNKGKQGGKLSKKRPTAKKGEGAPKPAPRIPGRKAALEELSVGAPVLVLSSESHYVRGTVSELRGGEMVGVTLNTGMAIDLPLERILIAEEKK